jgi:hypothetical protein
MRKSVILSVILFSGLVYNTAKAQVSIHIGFNTPVRHVYVPAPQPVETVYDDDFDNSDDYYYLPEVEAYYSIPLNRYFYYNDSRWVSAAYLPGAYRNYDWRTARRFEVRGRRPYINHDVYRGRWGGNNNRDWNRGNNYYADRNNNRYNNRNDSYRGNNQPSRNNGYNQPNRNDNRGRGNWGGDQSEQNRRQQSNDRGYDRRDNRSQPSNNNGGGRDRGNNSGDQFAQTQNPRQSGFARPRL